MDFKGNLFTIGQTAKISNISIQTLRFYDKIDLIKPTHVDPQSGYRFYSNEDILHIKIIQDLREMQFSLEEISTLIKGGNIASLIKQMQRKKEEIEREKLILENVISSMEKRIEKMDIHQNLLKEFVNADVFVEMKHIPERCVAADRRRSACGMEPYTLRFVELIDSFPKDQILPGGNYLAIYHENILTFDRLDSDIELCIPLIETGEEISGTRRISGGLYLCASYSGIGEENTCKSLYLQLLEWMEKEGYEEAGPVIEEYKIDLTNMVNLDNFIIELQIPVKKGLTL